MIEVFVLNSQTFVNTDGKTLYPIFVDVSKYASKRVYDKTNANNSDNNVLSFDMNAFLVNPAINNISGNNITLLSQLTSDSLHRTVTDAQILLFTNKQNTLISGTSIKTINSNTLLGSGDITIWQPSGASSQFLKGDGSLDNHTYLDNTYNPDWNAVGGSKYISNKPTIPSAQVQTDWNAVSGLGVLLNKPTLATVATSGSYADLSTKPTIPAAQVNSDWNAVSGVAQILNKPTIPTVGTWGALSYPTWSSGTPFVKMTTVGTFALDTNTYLSTITGSNLDNVFTTNGLLKRTGSGTYTIDTNTYLTSLTGAAILAGITGGQTLIGGIGITDTLILQSSTANTTSSAVGILFKVGNNGGTTAMTILNDGRVGIGITPPTAKLHIGAATSSAGTGSLKITPGTLLVTPEDGLYEYDGSNYYVSVSTNRYTLLTSNNGLQLSGGTLVGNCILAANSNIQLTTPTTINGYATGVITITYNSGYTSSAIGDLVYLDSSKTWQKCDNTTSVTTFGGLIGVALAVAASGASLKVALPGSFIYCVSFPTLTIGAPVYMSTTGTIVVTQPSGSSNAIRVIGWAVDTKTIYFNPSADYLIHT